MMPNNFVGVQKLREMGFYMQKNSKQIDYFMEKVSEEKITNKNFLETSCKLPGYPRSTFLMVYSPDGTKVASTHGDHNIYVSDIKTGKCVSKLQGHPRTPWCVAFHPASNEILASGCLAGQVRVWDLHGGSEIWMTDKQNAITSLTFHPSDHVLVIATGNELFFWDWSLPKPFASCCTKNTKEKIRYVKFDALGHKLVTGIANTRLNQNFPERSESFSYLNAEDDPNSDYNSDLSSWNPGESSREAGDVSPSEDQERGIQPAFGDDIDPLLLSDRNPVASQEDQSTQTAVDSSSARSRQTRYFLRDLPSTTTYEEQRALNRQLQDLNIQNRGDRTLTFSVRYRSRFRLTPPPSRLFEPYRLSFRQPTPRRSRYVLLRNSLPLRHGHRNPLDSRYVRLESDNWLSLIRNMRDRELNRGSMTSHSEADRGEQQEIQRIHQLLRRLRIQIHNLQSSVSNINPLPESSNSVVSRPPHGDIASQVRRDNLERLLVTAETAVSLAMESYEELNREALRSSADTSSSVSLDDPLSLSSSSGRIENSADVPDPVASEDPSSEQSGSHSLHLLRLTLRNNRCSLPPPRVPSGESSSPSSHSSTTALPQADPDSTASDEMPNNPDRSIDYQVMNGLLETWQRRLQLCEIRARAFRRRERHIRQSNEVEERPISRLPNPFAEPTIPFQSEIVSREALVPQSPSPQPTEPPHSDHSDYTADSSWPSHLSSPRPIPVIQIENVYGQRSTVDPTVNFNEESRDSPSIDQLIGMAVRPVSALADRRESLSPTPESMMRWFHRPPLVRQSAVNFQNIGYPMSSVEYPIRRLSDYPPNDDPLVNNNLLYVDDEVDEELDRWSFFRGLESNRYEGAILREYSSLIGGSAFNPTHRIQVWDFSSCCIPNISDTIANVLVPECKIHNDANVDISNDGRLLATFVASTLPANTRLGVYSMEKASFGQCLYRWNCGPNAVSVSISPQANYIIVGLSNRKITPAEKQVVARIFKLEIWKGNPRPVLKHVRNIEQLGGVLNRISLNCIKWLPTSGQGIIYATNRGQLQLLT